MEPYFITCTTCQARLKVVNEAAIGQVLACPKCSSMVLVTPPDRPSGVASAKQTQAPGSHPQSRDKNDTSDTVPDPGLAAPTDLAHLPGNPPAAGSISPPQRTKSARSTTPAEIASRDSKASVGSRPLTAGPSSAATGRSQTPNVPRQEAPTIVRVRRTALLAIGAGSGILLAIIVVSYFFHEANPHGNTPLAASTTDRGNSSPATGNATKSEATSPPEAVKSADGDSASEPSEPSEPNASPADSNPPGASSTPVAKEPEKQDDPFKSPLPNPPPDPPKKTDDSIGTDSTPAATDAPPDLDRNKKPITGDKIFDGLGKFDEFLRDGNAASPAETGHSKFRSRSVPRPPYAPVDVDARLSDIVTSIEISKMPLLDFVRFMSDMSTIPITVPTEVLEEGKLDVNVPVSVKKGDSSVEEVLEAALTPLGLTYRSDAGQMFLVLASWPEETVTAEIDVSDLLAANPNAGSQIADAIMDYVGPKTWAKSGGIGAAQVDEGKLRVENEPPFVFQTRLFCERMRIARGLPVKDQMVSGAFVPFRCDAARTAMEKNVTLKFPQDAPFVRIISQIEKETGLRVLVNWYALAEMEWGRNAVGNVLAKDKPLGDTLTSLLDRMDLGWRVINDHVIEITSKDRLLTEWDVEIYPIGNLLIEGRKPDEVIKSLKSRIVDKSAREEFVGVIRFDPPSKTLFTAMPQSFQRRLRRVIGE